MAAASAGSAPVDSFLLESGSVASPVGAKKSRKFQRGPADALRCAPPSTQGPGLLQRLLGLFGGKKDKAKTPPAVNREPYRHRLADALQAIRQHPTTDAGSRLDVLRALTPTLEAVFTEWTQAGERDDAVRRLGEAAVALNALLAEPKPADKAVAELWARTEAAVLACLTLCGGPPVTARREGFWK